MDVSVIIVNYNTCKLTQDCIDSVLRMTCDVDYEIIIVDNASKDGSKDLFENLEKKGILKYIYSYENMGFGRANNVGIMLAKGEYIFLLNSDTYLHNNAVKLFYDYAQTHERKAFYGSWLMDKNGNSIHSGGKEMSIKSVLRMASQAWLNRMPLLDSNLANYSNDALNEGRECQEVGYVTGADLFFHRSVIELCGWFDHRFFMYCEETDWQKRAKKQGILSYILKGPEIVHLQDFSKKPSMNGIKMRWDSTKLYFKKHYPRYSYYYFRSMYFILRFIPVLFDTNFTLSQRMRHIGAILK